MTRIGIFLLLAATAASAQWEKLALPDSLLYVTYWGNPRLAADERGRLYFSNAGRPCDSCSTVGGSLLMSDDGGDSWSAFAPSPLPWNNPLAVSGDGLILWGKWRSLDRGRSWDSTPFTESIYVLVSAIGANGLFLAGSGYDAIYRSLDSGRTWTETHFGRTFGSIAAFAFAGPWIFAAPQYDHLLASGDGGATWSMWTPNGGGDTAQIDAAVTAMAPDYFGALPRLWAVYRGRSGKALYHITPAIGLFDSVPAVLPDSGITSLLQKSDGSLWMGTRGQGVFVSRDQGLSWLSANQGINLFIHSLAQTSDGRIFAFAQDGVYRNGLGSAVFPGLGKPGRPRIPGLGFPLIQKGADWFRIDGRKL